MARLLQSTFKEVVSMNINTHFENEIVDTKVVNIGNEESIRFNNYGEVETVSGIVDDIVLFGRKVTMVNPNNPKDYFARDIRVKEVVVDASEHFDSKLYKIDAFEILEDEEVSCDKITVVPNLSVECELKYSDNTTLEETIEIGNFLRDVTVLTNPGEEATVGDFEVVAWGYIITKFNTVHADSMWLKPTTGKKAIKVPFNRIIRFNKATASGGVTETNNLNEIRTLLTESEDGFAFAKFEADVEIPIRDDGKISTVMINDGQTLELDLNGHDLTVKAYAFYVNGGTLVIRNNGTNSGKIIAGMPNSAYPAVFVASGGKCIMESGVVDTTNVDTSNGDVNWMYGVVCSGDGIFEMTGGKIRTGSAAGISITNGTASGEGAKFIIGGNSVLESVDNVAVYLADNKAVVVKDNARIIGGILLRMGDIIVEDNAYIEGSTIDYGDVRLADVAVTSGCDSCNGAITAVTGCYNSSLGNDINIFVDKKAKLKSNFDSPIVIVTLNTLYDQNVNVNVVNPTSLIRKTKFNAYRIISHDEIAEVAATIGRTTKPENNVTNLTITIDGKVVN